MARQKANMSDLLKENQKFQALPSAAEQQQDGEKDINTATVQNLDTASHQNDNTISSESSNTVVPQKDNEEIPQSGQTISSKKTPASEPKNTNTTKQQKGNNTKPQSDKRILSQPINTAIPQSDTPSDKRDRVTFYLNPGQREKLEELRIEYRKKTGERINEQELIRRVIDRLTLNSLLY
jgi:hypothetical protein